MSSRSTCSETPVKTMSSFDHFVTQWMSTVTVSLRSARSSSHVQATGSSTAPRIVKLHDSRGRCGVGPAESTGKSSVTYWPGGTRAGSASARLRPRKPREIGDITFPRAGCGPVRLRSCLLLLAGARRSSHRLFRFRHTRRISQMTDEILGDYRSNARTTAERASPPDDDSRGERMPGEIVHIEIPADDTEKGREFWGSLFGWQFQSFPGPSEYHVTQRSDRAGAPITNVEP